MKINRFLIITMMIPLMSICIGGCEKFVNENNSSSSQSNNSINSITSSSSSTKIDVSSISTSDNTIMSTTSKITSSSNADITTKTKIFDFSNYTYIGGYTTGNYDTTTVDNIGFVHYRAVKPEMYGEMIKLLPYASDINDTSMAGMIYNTTPILGIKEILVSYRTENSSGTKPILKYGNDVSTANSEELPLSTTTISHKVDISNANYFKIETNGFPLHITSIEIKYNDIGTPESYEYLGSGTGDFRINPVRYNGELVSGESSVSIPISVTRDGDNYIVNEYKTYTYYSYDDVSNNTSLASAASYTSPEDVAAYFTAFGTYPANYVLKKNYKTAANIFGEDTRCVSSYKRTDGYARFVPWTNAPGQTYPIYYECDIALDDTYSSSSRGVGRVVVWLYGFEAEGYDDSPVAVYTDDHYATFQEYLNTGRYGTRFNSEMSPTNYIWGTPAILTAK